MTAATKNVFIDILSAQELLDHVVSHMIKQGKTCYSILHEQINCHHRNHRGHACAIGCLMTDEEAKAADAIQNTMGSMRISDLAERGLLPQRLASHIPLLNELQEAHDQAAEFGGDCLETFLEGAEKIARTHGLRVNGDIADRPAHSRPFVPSGEPSVGPAPF